MRINQFLDDLASIKLESVFNPYLDRCELHDKPNAPLIRRQNLKTFFEANSSSVKSIWIGRDLGYRGGRRTGLPFTDEFHLDTFSHVFGGGNVSQATIGPPIAERTATIIWKMVLRLPHSPFLWNIFPLHPFNPDNPMSNRNHTVRERYVCEALLDRLFAFLRPERIIAIGNDAYKALSRLGHPCEYVRHPSYGGQATFIKGISSIYNLTPIIEEKQLEFV